MHYVLAWKGLAKRKKLTSLSLNPKEKILEPKVQDIEARDIQENKEFNNSRLLTSNDIDRQLAKLEKQEQEKRPDSSNPLVNKLKNFSKIVFSRESTYRGLVDTFAIDLPSLIAATSRGTKYFIEDVFKLTSATGMIFASPWVMRQVAKVVGKKHFNEDDQKNIRNYMLFSREELEDNEKFDKARARIIKEEVQDQLNLIKIFGTKSKVAKHCRKNAKQIVEFMNSYKADDETREKALMLKDEVIKSQSWVEGAFWGGLPFVKRLFRKYVLGVDRFTGTMKYLSDKDNDKLQNKKIFKLMQIVGTPISMFAGPTFVQWLMKKIKNKQLVEKSPFFKMVNNQLDMKHGFYPKLGLFATYGELSLFTSRLFNSQDIFELTENAVKFFVSAASIFFGDRVTTGFFAKSADKEFVDKYKVEPGLMYHKPKIEEGQKPTWTQKFQEAMPEATKFNDLVEKTKHNPKLEKEATHRFQSIFYKGFTLHAAATYLLKRLVYHFTKSNVMNAMKKKG